MIALIDDIIKLSHLDEDAEDMQREDVDLLAVARSEAANLDQAAEDAGVELTVSVVSSIRSAAPATLLPDITGLAYSL